MQADTQTVIDEQALAAILDQAAMNAREIDRISLAHPIDLDAAYRIQALNIGRRLARGERLVGMKMGFTSVAKMRQMGVAESIWGRLTDAMEVGSGGELAFSRYVHPRAEPEIAFRLKHALSGEVSRDEALAAIETVAPAIEIIDSRYRDFKFTLVDVVADNSSSSSFVLGEWRSPPDLADLKVSLEIDGEVVQSGSTAAILDDPVQSLVAAARLAHAGGDPLQAGWIVLAGAATEAVALKPGMRVRAVVEQLGAAAFTVTL